MGICEKDKIGGGSNMSDHNSVTSFKIQSVFVRYWPSNSSWNQKYIRIDKI
jgi:hypothetical protein